MTEIWAIQDVIEALMADDIDALGNCSAVLLTGCEGNLGNAFLKRRDADASFLSRICEFYYLRAQNNRRFLAAHRAALIKTG